LATPATTPPPSPRPLTPARGTATAAPPVEGFARLERFWNAHADAIFRAAHRVTGNPADAEDVLQTVFLRLARRGDDEIDEQGVGGYLHRSAVNAALDVLRSRQRAGWVPLEPAAGGADLHADSAPDPEREQASRELRAHLRLAMSRLAPRAAEIFALRYFEGLPNREIAGLLGVSQGLVAVLLHRTRARLRKELATLEGAAR
jgi:RNA polymerase sigma-70 factor (ECF subfamily)